jgi:uncharacterized protein (DUF2141 family)
MKHIDKFSRLALCAALLVWVGAATAADLTIEVRGVANDKGSVLAAIYDKTETWMKTTVGTARAAARQGVVTLTLKDLADGEYAASLFHDENGNGKLDRNAFGMPTEPYGFSMDARGKFGPPPFERAKFKLDASNGNIVVNIK